MHGDYREVPLEDLGGRYTRGDPQDCPSGMSPDELNNDFEPGLVKSRPGTTVLGTVGSGIMGMEEFALLDNVTRYVLITNNQGQLYRENGNLTFTEIADHLGNNAHFVGTSLAGRHWLAFSEDGQLGTEVPLQYDGTNLVPATNCGPGKGPTLAESGTAGSVTVGKHVARCYFRMRSGHITAASPSVELMCTGEKTIDATEIPIGPADTCVGRIIGFSPAGSIRPFYIPGSAMDIKDNTTQSVAAIDFTDEELINSVSLENRRGLIELPPVAFFGKFNNRLMAVGAPDVQIRNLDEGFINLSFNGGFFINSGGNVNPAGWTTMAAGGLAASATPLGDCYRITGDGASGQRGKIENNFPAYRFLKPGITYRMRVRLRKKRNGQTGSVHFWVADFSEPGFPVFNSIAFDSSELSTDWGWFDQQFIAAVDNVPGREWVFRLAGGRPGDGTVISNGDYIEIKDIAFYEAGKYRAGHVAHVSRSEDPEAFDGREGLNVIDEGLGELRCGFGLRKTWYWVSSEATFKVADNDLEPSYWGIEQVANSVGTPSARGVAATETWAVIAAKSGPHVFTGSVPIPIGDGIRDEWVNRINWLYGYKIWVRIDTLRQRVLIGVPLDGAIAVSHVWNLRYFGLTPAESSISLWDLRTSEQYDTECAVLSTRGTGETQLWLGSSSGQVRQLDTDTHMDNGTYPFTSYYRVAYVGKQSQRLLLGSVSANVAGAGAIDLQVFGPDNTMRKQCPSKTIYDPATKDVEWGVTSVKGERLSLRFGVSGDDDSYYRITKLAVFVKPLPHAPSRGMNA